MNTFTKSELDSELRTAIQSYLTNEDDLDFWLAAFDTLTRDFESLYSLESKTHSIFIQIGACSHWLRPHQTRLTAAGGFAYPSGYLGGGYSRDGLPELDWFVLLYRDQKENKWILSEKFFGKRKLVCRIALPTRTLRHNQAAINVLWSPGTPNNPNKKLAMFYGFKKIKGVWKYITSNEW